MASQEPGGKPYRATLTGRSAADPASSVRGCRFADHGSLTGETCSRGYWKRNVEVFEARVVASIILASNILGASETPGLIRHHPPHCRTCRPRDTREGLAWPTSARRHRTSALDADESSRIRRVDWLGNSMNLSYSCFVPPLWRMLRGFDWTTDFPASRTSTPTELSTNAIHQHCPFAKKVGQACRPSRSDRQVSQAIPPSRLLSD
jgi:hypothetical protein